MPDNAIVKLMNDFNNAFLKHDPSLLDGLIADDCVLENNAPGPDGARHVGGAACREFWAGIAADENAQFEPEEIWGSEDRGIIRWTLRWGPGPTDYVRGVNLMKVRDGKIIEAMGYVKS